MANIQQLVKRVPQGVTNVSPNCDNGYGNTEVINGVTYGWHQTRGKAAYIQKKMASIVESTIRNL